MAPAPRPLLPDSRRNAPRPGLVYPEVFSYRAHLSIRYAGHMAGERSRSFPKDAAGAARRGVGESYRALRRAAGDQRLVDRIVSEVDRLSPESARTLRQLDRLATVDHLRAMESLLGLAVPCSVAIVGPVNSGKSTLANALAGRRVAAVAATPGTTRVPERHDALGLGLVDTPGADEVAGEERRRLALGEVDRAGLVLVVLDAARGVTLSDRDVFDAVVDRLAGGPGARTDAATLADSGRLVVCLNKMDLVPRRERDEVRRRAARDLRLAADHVLAVSALKERGLDALARQLVASAPAMAEALAEAMPAYVDDLAAGLITRHAAVAATVALAPVPGPDVLPLTAIQALLVVRLARLYGREMSWKRSGEVLPAVAAGLGFRELFRQAAKLFPGPGWALSGGIAYAGTVATGKAAQHLLKTGAPPSFRQLVAWRREAGRRRQELRSKSA
jgi:GTP-binding protein Era